MKPHKAKDIRELTDTELSVLLEEKRETLAKQRFQHALKQLHDTAYLKILKKDIARINTLITERQMSKVDE
ncbi:MAG: 50S ribosomal protein L29 [bacterium]|jgi:large subunit ribosomal protein L29